MKAERAGIVATIDCLRMNRLARTAGAPIDKGAGIRLFKKIGDRVEQSEPLYRIFAVDQPRPRRQEWTPVTRSNRPRRPAWRHRERGFTSCPP